MVHKTKPINFVAEHRIQTALFSAGKLPLKLPQRKDAKLHSQINAVNIVIPRIA